MHCSSQDAILVHAVVRLSGPDQPQPGPVLFRVSKDLKSSIFIPYLYETLRVYRLSAQYPWCQGRIV